MQSGVYCILNTVNGKRYVGQSGNLKQRCRSHMTMLRAGTHYNTHLQAAFNKYGESKLTWQITEECVPESLDAREKDWIAYYSATNPAFGYNNESGGNALKVCTEATRAKMSAAKLGRRHTEEAKARMSARAKGRTFSLESRARMSAAQSRRAPCSDIIRAKISASMKGKPGRAHSADERARMSIARKGRVCSEETRARMSASRLGWNPSPETRARISLAAKECWARQRRPNLQANDQTKL